MAQPLFLCCLCRSDAFEGLRKDGVNIHLVGGVCNRVARDDGLRAVFEQEGRGVICEDGVDAHAMWLAESERLGPLDGLCHGLPCGDDVVDDDRGK